MVWPGTGGATYNHPLRAYSLTHQGQGPTFPSYPYPAHKLRAQQTGYRIKTLELGIIGEHLIVFKWGFRLSSRRVKKLIRTIVPRSARNWLRSPSKSLEWLWDSVSFSVGTTRELALLPGWHLTCHPRVYRTFRRSQLSDPAESAEFQNFAKHCDPSTRLLDIGASFGAFSLVAAHFGGKAIAVDPSPIATRLIRVQTRLNGYEERIRIIEACVGDSVGEIEMLSSGVFSDGYFRMTHSRPKSELTKTRAVTLDQLTDLYGPPTHVKIDVEGHESAVIKGAKKTLTHLAPMLFLELHNEIIRSEGADPEDVLNDLEEMGYGMFSVNDAKIDRSAILQMPICRLVGKRGSSAEPTSADERNIGV